MELRVLLLGFVAWGLYPAWLIAGGCDYLAHRRTDIAHTSRATESWLHLAQLATIAAILIPAALFEVTRVVWIWMIVAVLLHSVLAYVDVEYTDGRRYISPFEQTAHGFLDVLPVVAVALLGLAHWPQIAASGLDVVANDASTGLRSALLLSFVVLAGTPVCEELIRTLRARSFFTKVIHQG
jgi:cytochrome bd-type quinol oxidase subunit 2